MARKFSERTMALYFWLWHLPWASAPDLAALTGLSERAVGRILGDASKKGWVKPASLGRGRDAVQRWVFLPLGIEWFESRHRWIRHWWHTAQGIEELARRINIVELVYAVTIPFFQSNAIRDSDIHVIRESPIIDEDTGQPRSRRYLEKADWRNGRLCGFYWLKDGPFEAVAVYENGFENDGKFFLPIMWRGLFHGRSHMREIRYQMPNLLVENWRRTRMDIRFAEGYPPGMLVLCPDQATAVMARKHLKDNVRHIDDVLVTAIVTADLQVIERMGTPTAMWERVRVPDTGADLGDVARAVDRLKTGPYVAVNGKGRWREFRRMSESPGLTLQQYAAFYRLESKPIDAGRKPRTSPVSAILNPMTNNGVATSLGDGYYLNPAGWQLLAGSEHFPVNRISSRLKVYTSPGGRYRRQQSRHGKFTGDTRLALLHHELVSFSALGVVIEAYDRYGKTVKVSPDGFLLLPPGILVAIECERSAKSLPDVTVKASHYRDMTLAGVPIIVLFVTESEEAAMNFARVGLTNLLATTLEKIQKEPQGRAELTDRIRVIEPGPWCFQYAKEDNPSFTAPINLLSEYYAKDHRYDTWRLPMNRPLQWVDRGSSLAESESFLNYLVSKYK